MNFNVKKIEFDFDDDYADTVCNSDLDTFFIASEVDRKEVTEEHLGVWEADSCLLYTSPSPRDRG